VKNFNNEKILLSIVIFIALLLVAKTFKLPTTGTVDVSIMQQKGAIATVDTVKKLSSTKHILVDSINFLQSRTLQHPNLGKLGYSRNIFLNAKTQMSVLKPGEYIFLVSSDDGFRLKIDNKTVCEHPGDRPMKTTVCRVNLSKSDHFFNLMYFQGGGPMGLKVRYRLKGDSSLYYVGANSKYIKFKAVK
jgi:hypothetical protein